MYRVDLKQLIVEFVEEVRASSHVELYNTAGLRHELAVFLRHKLPRDKYGLQLEREVEAVAMHPGETTFVQENIGIYLFNVAGEEQYGIQIQVAPGLADPNDFYKMAESVKFLEQLTEDGFQEGCFLFASPNPALWSDPDAGFGHYFPGENQPLVGSLRPNGKFAACGPGEDSVNLNAGLPPGDDAFLFRLRKNYPITWLDLQPAKQGDAKAWKCFLLQVIDPDR